MIKIVTEIVIIIRLFTHSMNIVHLMIHTYCHDHIIAKIRMTTSLMTLVRSVRRLLPLDLLWWHGLLGFLAVSPPDFACAWSLSDRSVEHRHSKVMVVVFVVCGGISGVALAVRSHSHR